MVVCHSMRGRIRVRFASVRWSHRGADAFAKGLLNHPAVKEADVRLITGSIIIRYDPRKTDREAILAVLREIFAEIGAHSPDPGSIAAEGLSHVSSAPGGDGRFGFGFRLLWVTGLTVFTIYDLVRRIVFKSPLAGGMLTPTGLIAAVLGPYPSFGTVSKTLFINGVWASTSSWERQPFWPLSRARPLPPSKSSGSRPCPCSSRTM